MANNYHERDYDDEVYEDDYYKDRHNGEEIEEEIELSDEDEGKSEADIIDDDSDDEKRITMSFACDDCDYRWDDVIIKINGNLEDEENEIDAVCPMCGSVNVTQI